MMLQMIEEVSFVILLMGFFFCQQSNYVADNITTFPRPIHYILRTACSCI